MTSPQPAHVIIQDPRGVATALWLASRTAKAERISDVEEGEAGGRRSAGRHGDIECGWIKQGVWRKRQVDPVETQTDRVCKRRAKNVVLAQRQQVPETVASISKPREIRGNGPAGGRLLAEILLNDVVAVDAIPVRQLNVQVGRSLIERNVG
jgi:hypothetical protein